MQTDQIRNSYVYTYITYIWIVNIDVYSLFLNIQQLLSLICETPYIKAKSWESQYWDIQSNLKSNNTGSVFSDCH